MLITQIGGNGGTGWKAMVRNGRFLAYFEALDLADTFRGASMIPDDGSTLHRWRMTGSTKYVSTKASIITFSHGCSLCSRSEIGTRDMTCAGRTARRIPVEMLGAQSRRRMHLPSSFCEAAEAIPNGMRRLNCGGIHWRSGILVSAGLS